MKQYQKAIADYTKAIEINPNFAGTYKNRGLSKIRLEDLTGAIADFRRAIELVPQYAPAYTNLGLALNKQGKLKRLLKTLAKRSN